MARCSPPTTSVTDASLETQSSGAAGGMRNEAASAGRPRRVTRGVADTRIFFFAMRFVLWREERGKETMVMNYSKVAEGVIDLNTVHSCRSEGKEAGQWVG